jgi:aryl carrier-like protein
LALLVRLPVVELNDLVDRSRSHVVWQRVLLLVGINSLRRWIWRARWRREIRNGR